MHTPVGQRNRSQNNTEPFKFVNSALILIGNGS